MKILKKFDSYIKEDLEMMAEPATKPSTTPAPATPTVEPGTKPERRDRPTPIRRDRPAVDPDPQAKMKIDATEEEGTYIGTEMLQDLADALGAEVMDNSVEYEGKKVNFYSETEKFHVDKKKFSTVEEVVDYLTGGESAIEKEMRETEEEKAKQMIEDESMEDELEEEVEDLEDEFEEDEEEIVRGRHIKEFENFIHDEDEDDWNEEDPEDWKVSQTLFSSENDDELSRELDGEYDEFEEEEFGDRKTSSGSFINPEEDEYFEDEEEVCPECGIAECGYDHGADSDEECVPCKESHITKKFNNFR